MCIPGTFASDENWATSESGNALQVIKGATSCESCGLGTFGGSSGGIFCQKCNFPAYTFKERSQICDRCVAGYYYAVGASDDQSSCVKCPLTTTCEAGVVIPAPNKGYWIDTSSPFNVDPIIYRCQFPPRCKGTSSEDSHLWLDLNSTSRQVDVSCHTGSQGVLCGSCASGFVSARDLSCTSCSAQIQITIIFLSTLGCFAIALAVIVATKVCAQSRSAMTMRVLQITHQVPSGTFRVCFSTYQIIDSTSWTLNIQVPFPANVLADVFSIFSFNPPSITCFISSSYLSSILFWACVPIFVQLFGMTVGLIRVYTSPAVGSVRWKIQQQHMYGALLLSFIVAPPVSRLLLSGLDCINVARGSYLRLDTSVDCSSIYYRDFVAVDIVFIALYFSIPFVWFLLLARNRKSPALKFLWGPWRQGMQFGECFEFYRRVLLIGGLPLLSVRAPRRAAAGLFVGLASLVIFRELEPFSSSATNIILNASQLVIIVNYSTALILSTDLSKGVPNLIFGLILAVVNLTVIVLAIYLGGQRFMREEKKLAQIRAATVLSPREFEILDAVMNLKAPRPSLGGEDLSGKGKGIEMANRADPSSMSAQEQQDIAEARILEKVAINPKDLEILKQIGSGAFGAVFHGVIHNENVAVKTMKNVSESNARDFRQEILVTARLVHPNIVKFVGAAWSKELCALLLEWVPRGSLGELLESSNEMSWADPLLRLAMDTALGMAYLHSRRFFDETDGMWKECILHRDLKPDNVLVTDFLAGKVSDFGTSRGKGVENELMTGTGTPVFCAPEISRGDVYDESVDVYSFGLLLVCMATHVNIVDFLLQRWAKSHNKAKVPKSLAKPFRDITENGWRPVTVDEPIPGAPSTISSLIVQCCSADPLLRPAFKAIIAELDGSCRAEIEAGSFFRRPITVAETPPPLPPAPDFAPVPASAHPTNPSEVKVRSENGAGGDEEVGLDFSAGTRQSAPVAFNLANPLLRQSTQGSVVTEVSDV